MTPRQTKIVIVLAFAIGLLSIAVGAAALVGGSGDDHPATTADDGASTTSSTTTTSPSRTTVSLRPVTPPTTAHSEVSSDTSEQTTTTASGTAVGGDGAVLRRTTTGDDRHRAPGAGCTTMALTGYRAQCGDVSDGDDDFVWMVERRLTNGGFRATVFRRSGESDYRPVLEALDDGPAGPVRFAAVTVRVADVSGDRTPEIVFGFRGQGSGALLDLDLVDVGRVAVHRTLDQGRAEAKDGRLDDWSAEFGPNDAACCPSRFRHGVVRFADGAWRLVASTLEPASQVPEGQFA